MAKAVPYLRLVVAFDALVYAFHTYLDIRQLKALQLPKPPKALEDDIDAKEYAKTKEYQIDKWWFGLVQGLYGFTETILSLQLFYLPFLWRASKSLAMRIGLNPGNEIAVTVLFFLLDNAKEMMFALPWSLWGTFVIEQRHGFNKQTLGVFVADRIKMALLGLLLAPPIVAGFTWLLLRTSPYLALYLWAFLLALQLFFLTAYPIFIAPLFNRFDPLPPGPLREAIETLAGSLAFPLRKLFVIDGSRRSAHSNAYMYGLWKNKRIVLYDTLIEQCDQSEVVAVLAHELGHWKLGHTIKNLVLGEITSLITFSLFALVRSSPGLYASFGFVEEQPVFVAFILFSTISAPLNEVVGLLTNILSRRFEFEADGFAVKLGHHQSLCRALKKLDAKNRSATNVDMLYSAYHYSHPPLVERLSAIDADAKKSQ